MNLTYAISSYKLVYKYVDLKVFSSQIVLCICSETFLIKTMITNHFGTMKLEKFYKKIILKFIFTGLF